ncbi:CYTH domain-containing protein [bacterium]|nr:CYTH domain-containing protein [bacterium]
MAKEIERKFLVDFELLKSLGLLDKGSTIKQAYIPTVGLTAVRLRVKGSVAFLTIKGANKGVTRSEFEYQIPVKDAEAMINDLCSGPLIEKVRYEIRSTQNPKHIWEVDVFEGDNQGLVVAELEIADEKENFERPSWLGEEVSGDAKYYNSNLLDNPFKDW